MPKKTSRRRSRHAEKRDVLAVLDLLLSHARTILQGIVFVCLLGVSLYIILSYRYDEAAKRWAFGISGTLLGLWLKH
jgi:hypothetical protein